MYRLSSNFRSFSFSLFSEEERDVENAVVRGDLEKLKILLENRKDKNPVTYVFPDGVGVTVLHGAAYEGHVNIIRWYKDVLGFSDINPKDNKGITPLYWATVEGHLDVVKYYIINGYHASSKVSKEFKKVS